MPTPNVKFVLDETARAVIAAATPMEELLETKPVFEYDSCSVDADDHTLVLAFNLAPFGTFEIKIPLTDPADVRRELEVMLFCISPEMLKQFNVPEPGDDAPDA